MTCRFLGDGVSQESSQQKKGRERSLRCTENRAAVHNFLGSSGYSSVASCRFLSKSLLSVRGFMKRKTQNSLLGNKGHPN